MPPEETAKLTSMMERLIQSNMAIGDEIKSLHKDLKESFHYLVHALHIHHETERDEQPAAPSQIDLFATQSNSIPSGRERFKFPSDEKELQNSFESQVTQCITTVKAEWNKLVKNHCKNFHQSIRNSSLSKKYRAWLQRDTPFIRKKYRPRPTNPVNAEIDAILLEQAKASVESECRVMDLYAKSAQTRNEDVKKQLTELVDGLSADAKTKDAVFRKWNEEVLQGETRELKKWETKEAFFDKLPDNPELEDQEPTTPQDSTPTSAAKNQQPTNSAKKKQKNVSKQNSAAPHPTGNKQQNPQMQQNRGPQQKKPRQPKQQQQQPKPQRQQPQHQQSGPSNRTAASGQKQNRGQKNQNPPPQPTHATAHSDAETNERYLRQGARPKNATFAATVAGNNRDGRVFQKKKPPPARQKKQK